MKFDKNALDVLVTHYIFVYELSCYEHDLHGESRECYVESREYCDELGDESGEESSRKNCVNPI